MPAVVDSINAVSRTCWFLGVIGVFFWCKVVTASAKRMHVGGPNVAVVLCAGAGR